MTQEQLYDSEATLRLVDRLLEDLDMSDPARSAARSRSGYRTEQLRDEPGEAHVASPLFLRVFWEIHDALELLRDSQAALLPSLDTNRSGGDEERGRLDRALALADQLQSEEGDPLRGPAHGALREELLALAGDLRSREAATDRLHLAADLLLHLEDRLAQLARAFDAGRGDAPV